MTRRTPRVVSGLFAALCAVFSATGCYFSPVIDEAGFPQCEATADCPPGRYCRDTQCYSPPWFSETYASRQLLTVSNETDGDLEAGTAIPVVIGEGGLLSAADLGAEGLFVAYDEAALDTDEPDDGWSEVPVYRDIENDRLTAWLALPFDVPQDRTEALAFVVTETLRQEATLEDNPLEVFDFFDDLSLMTVLDTINYEDVGSSPILVEPGIMTLADNAQLIVREPLVQPSTFYVKGRVNGNNCDALFIGAIGDDRVGTELPYAGFFFGAGLLLAADVAPTSESAPAYLSEPAAIDAPNAAHVYGLHLGGGKVRLTIDGELFDEGTDIRPPFEDVPLYMTIDVDGDNCSFEALGFWKTDRPFGDISTDKEVAHPFVEF